MNSNTSVEIILSQVIEGRLDLAKSTLQDLESIQDGSRQTKARIRIIDSVLAVFLDNFSYSPSDLRAVAPEANDPRLLVLARIAVAHKLLKEIASGRLSISESSINFLHPTDAEIVWMNENGLSAETVRLDVARKRIIYLLDQEDDDGAFATSNAFEDRGH